MTVAELIEKLKAMPPEAQVMVWAGERGEWEAEDVTISDTEPKQVCINAWDCLA